MIYETYLKYQSIVLICLLLSGCCETWDEIEVYDSDIDCPVSHIVIGVNDRE